MILFDLNGTLMDLTGTKRTIFSATLRDFKKWGFSGSEKELYGVFEKVDEELKYLPHELEEYPRRVAKKLGLRVSGKNIKKQNETFKKGMIAKTALISESESRLKQLAKLDELVLFSNGWNEIVFPLLEKHRILNYFSDVVCIGGTGMNKDRGHVFPELKLRGAWAMIGDKLESDGMSEKSKIKFFDIKKGWESIIQEIIDLKNQ